MAGYDGLALSLYDKNAQTFTDDGAHNFFSITISDSTTVTSGYIQPFYTSITQSGGESAGAQISAFAADITLGGTHAGEVSGAYIYFAETGTALFGGIFSGYTVYFGSFASATPPAYRAGFHCYSEEAAATIATGVDAGILVESAGQTGTWGAMLGGMGVVPPKYFLHWKDQGGTAAMFGDSLGSTSAVRSLRVKIYDTCYSIPLMASTSGA
jgi:hypothetical protein